MRLGIAELTQSGLTRKNGRDAAQTLLARDDGSEIIIDLDGTEFLSLSFLDEFVELATEAGILGRISFATEQQGRLDILGRVSDARDVVLYHLAGGKRAPVKRKPAPKLIEVSSPGGPPGDPW